MVASAQGADKSNFNHPGGWTSYDFGFCKATEGLTFRDDTFAANWGDLAAAGIPRGAYHFLHLDDDPAKQAQFFFAFVKAYGLRPGDMLVVDSETAGANADAVTHAFLAELAKLSAGLDVILLTYTDQNVGKTLTKTAADFPLLWFAWPEDTAPASVEPWASWVFWQWGQRDGLDLDAFNGTAADLAAWVTKQTGSAKPVSTKPAPSPAATTTEALVKQLPEVKSGQTGADVKTVQALCGARGHATNVDGIFGANTVTAVKAAQKAAKLTADGIVGPATWPVLLGV